MLMKLERDRLAAKVSSLEAQMRSLEAARPEEMDVAERTVKKAPRVAKLPEMRDNPYLSMVVEPAPVERWGLNKSYEAHGMS
eukprot:4296541-Pleurochrysis_carterae.AAC.1